MITEIDARLFGKLTSNPVAPSGRYWMTMDRQRLGFIELQEAPRWRAVVLDLDSDNHLYVPEHYADIWGSLSDVIKRLVEMLLAKPGPACGCALCISELDWGWELARRNL